MANVQKILILKEAGVVADIQDDLRNFKEYEQTRLGIKLEITERSIDLPGLTHESFKIAAVELKNGQPVYQNMYGLSGIKKRIRDLNIARPYQYDVVIFLYDLDDTDWAAKNRPAASIGHWTYFEPLYEGTSFVEIATRKSWKKDDPFRVLTHEFRHSCVFRLRALGHAVEDVMDSTFVPAEGKYVPYYKEYTVFAKDGNRAAQNQILMPYVDLLCFALGAKKKIFDLTGLLDSLMKQLMPPTQPSARLIKWAEAIKKHEGWYVGSRSYRTNNPGNFKGALTPYMKSLGASGRDPQGFMIFPTYQKGWEALLQFLKDAQANDLIPYREFATKRDQYLRSQGKPEGPKDRKGRSICTLQDFYQVYAPASDNVVPGFTNDPNAYALAVAKEIDGVGGVNIDTPIDKI